MGKKGGKKHLKRHSAPAHWPIVRKGFQWTTRPSSGPHSIDSSVPIGLILRDALHLVNTRRELSKIISEGSIRVDGKPCRRDDFPVGLMDLIEVIGLNKAFRVLPDRNGKLVLKQVSDDEKEFKLCKVLGKTTLKEGTTQLNLSGGRTLTLKTTEPHPGTDFKTSDVVKIKIPDNEILDLLKLDEGVLALVTNGKNVGRWGSVLKIDRSGNRLPDLVTIVEKGGEQALTIEDYTFTIGIDEPVISMLEND